MGRDVLNGHRYWPIEQLRSCQHASSRLLMGLRSVRYFRHQHQSQDLLNRRYWFSSCVCVCVCPPRCFELTTIFLTLTTHWVDTWQLTELTLIFFFVGRKTNSQLKLSLISEMLGSHDISHDSEGGFQIVGSLRQKRLFSELVIGFPS